MVMLLDGIVKMDELTSLVVVRSTRLIPVPSFWLGSSVTLGKSRLPGAAMLRNPYGRQ